MTVIGLGDGCVGVQCVAEGAERPRRQPSDAEAIQLENVLRRAHQRPFTPCTFSSRRSKNCRNPRACLICPITGSTIALRAAYTAAPVLVRSFRPCHQRAWQSSAADRADQAPGAPVFLLPRRDVRIDKLACYVERRIRPKRRPTPPASPVLLSRVVVRREFLTILLTRSCGGIETYIASAGERSHGSCDWAQNSGRTPAAHRRYGDRQSDVGRRARRRGASPQARTDGLSAHRSSRHAD